MHLSVVVPVYNQREKVISILEKINKYLSIQHYESEILVVDSGSNDGSFETIKNFSISCNKIKLLKINQHKGIGYATRKGVLVSTGDYVLVSDPQHYSPIEEIERLFYWLYQGYEAVTGSRNIFDPCVKNECGFGCKVLHNLQNFTLKYILPLQVEDFKCGFSAFTSKAAKTLFSKQKLASKNYDIEIIYLIHKNNLKYKEVAVSWKNEGTYFSSLIRDFIKLVADSFSIKKIHKDDIFISLEQSTQISQKEEIQTTATEAIEQTAFRLSA